MKWRFFPTAPLPDDFRSVWAALHREIAPNNPGLDVRFIDLLLRHFGEGTESAAILSDGSIPVGAAILRKSRKGTARLFKPGLE